MHGGKRGAAERCGTWLVAAISLGENRRLAPAAIPPIKKMRSNDCVLGHGGGPVGHDIVGMIMGCPPNRRIDETGQRFLGDADCPLPAFCIRRTVQRSVAGESELAPGRPRRALVNNSADA